MRQELTLSLTACHEASPEGGDKRTASIPKLVFLPYILALLTLKSHNKFKVNRRIHRRQSTH